MTSQETYDRAWVEIDSPPVSNITTNRILVDNSRRSSDLEITINYNVNLMLGILITIIVIVITCTGLLYCR